MYIYFIWDFDFMQSLVAWYTFLNFLFLHHTVIIKRFQVIYVFLSDNDEMTLIWISSFSNIQIFGETFFFFFYVRMVK